MGIKSQKGSVTVSNFRNRVRLRWRYQGVRYTISHSAFNAINLLQAKKLALQIEQDMVLGLFDQSLDRYNPKPEIPLSPRKLSPKPKVQVPFTLSSAFESWALSYKQIDCNQNMHYYGVRGMLRRWADISSAQILDKFNRENLGSQTYNERLSILQYFFGHLVKKKIWESNPLEGVCRRKVKKIDRPDRKPFSEDEISKILDVFKKDSIVISNRTKLSDFYPFLYFIFKTGVRNAEAVGLRVSHVDFANAHIHIKETLARTSKGTNASSRIRKETKNGKVRVLPLTKDLHELLFPLMANKHSDDLVFSTNRRLPIDDRMFQQRVFRPVLEELNIAYRVLYACRHTFGSRCIDHGITPVMTAFLMGNNPETALRNYTHMITLPKDLPKL